MELSPDKKIEALKSELDLVFDKNIKAYLRKPITPEELANKVNEILGGENK